MPTKLNAMLSSSSYTLKPAQRTAMIVGVVFALGWPLLLAAITPSQNLRNVGQDIVVLVAEWMAVAVLFAIVTFWERRPFFPTVGLIAPRRLDVIIVGLLALAVLAYSTFLATHHVSISRTQDRFLDQIVGLPLALRAALVFTAGVCEEILFRGYAIERLKALTGNVWIAALASTVLFTLAHTPRYGLSGGLLGVALIGAVLSAIYAWRGNLTVCITLHWFIDGLQLLLLPALVSLH